MKVTNTRYKRLPLAAFFLAVLLASLFYTPLQAQNKQKFKGLSIGDTLPDVKLKMFNYKSAWESTRALCGKWLILDFWETYCGACVSSVPRVDSLQKQFADQLNILLVSSKKQAQVQKTLERLMAGAYSHLGVAVEDSALNRLFPHNIIPHEIWIDPSGVIRAVSSGNDVNQENIRALISGQNRPISQKKDDLSWDFRQSMGGIASQDSAMLYRSTLHRYNASIGSAISFRSQQSTPKRFWKNHVYFSNLAPIQMYYVAYMVLTEGSGFNLNPNRIVVEIKDPAIRMRYANAGLTPTPFVPEKFPYMSWADQPSFNRDNGNSYDLLLPAAVADSVFLRYVFEDLNRFFPVKGKVQPRNLDCLVIVTKDKQLAQQRLAASGSKTSLITTDEKIGVSNATMDVFVKNQMTRFSSLPVVNETAIDYPVDLIIDFGGSALLDRKLGAVVNSPLDEVVFKKQLNLYGLDLIHTKRQIKALVLSD